MVYDIYNWGYLGISNSKWTSMCNLCGERDYSQYGGVLKKFTNNNFYIFGGYIHIMTDKCECGHDMKNHIGGIWCMGEAGEDGIYSLCDCLRTEKLLK